MDIIQFISEAFTDSKFRPAVISAEYQALVSTYSANLDTLFRRLSAEQKPLFFEAEAQRNLIAAMDEDCMFCFGFQIGAKLMLELIRPQTQ